jgi:glycosyltransferase involved in cell wall biosynthesis
VIAGGGDPTYRWALERQAREMGLADIVRWLGHVEGDERAAAFAAADVFVLPSYSENFGIAAVEAMMAGLPCVLTSGIAIAREAAEAGAVEMSEPHAEALRAALERLIQDDDLRRLRGAHARRFAQDRYSVDSMAQRLCELYRDVKRVNAP